MPGTNTQGRTLDEARANLEEAVSMVLGADATRESNGFCGADPLIRAGPPGPALLEPTNFAEADRGFGRPTRSSGDFQVATNPTGFQPVAV